MRLSNKNAESNEQTVSAALLMMSLKMYLKIQRSFDCSAYLNKEV